MNPKTETMGASNGNSLIKVNNLLFQMPICKIKMLAGNIDGKIPIRIDDRTTVYVSSNKTDEEIEQIKQKYAKYQ